MKRQNWSIMSRVIVPAPQIIPPLTLKNICNVLYPWLARHSLLSLFLLFLPILNQVNLSIFLSSYSLSIWYERIIIKKTKSAYVYQIEDSALSVISICMKWWSVTCRARFLAPIFWMQIFISFDMMILQSQLEKWPYCVQYLN